MPRHADERADDRSSGKNQRRNVIGRSAELQREDDAERARGPQRSSGYSENGPARVEFHRLHSGSQKRQREQDCGQEIGYSYAEEGANRSLVQQILSFVQNGDVGSPGKYGSDDKDQP